MAYIIENRNIIVVKYVNDYENFCAFQDITDDKRKMCGLLHCAGSDVQDIYETVKANPDVETTDSSTQVVKKEAAPGDKYAYVCRKLNAHFNPKRNVIYEIHVFRNLRQLDGENTLQFATRLREAARFCEFAYTRGSPEDGIGERIVDGPVKGNEIDKRNGL